MGRSGPRHGDRGGPQHGTAARDRGGDRPFKRTWKPLARGGTDRGTGTAADRGTGTAARDRGGDRPFKRTRKPLAQGGTGNNGP